MPRPLPPNPRHAERVAQQTAERSAHALESLARDTHSLYHLGVLLLTILRDTTKDGLTDEQKASLRLKTDAIIAKVTASSTSFDDELESLKSTS